MRHRRRARSIAAGLGPRARALRRPIASRTGSRALWLLVASALVCAAARAGDLDAAGRGRLASPGIAFSPPGGHFSVRLPVEPAAAATSTRRTLLGAIAETTYRVEVGDRRFALELRDLPAVAVFLLPSGTILDRARDGLREAVGGRLLDAREAPHRGHPAREIVYEIPGEPLRVERALLVLVGGRLYIALATWPAAADAGPAVDRLFESFEVWEP
ncbi:MAG TPA: hypothetical protein VIY27_04070 [Myxococcota bacterium]